MDYEEMNLGSWSSYLPRFKNLLRPDGADPIGEAEEDVESARGEDTAKPALSTISAALPNLVFEGYRDWYSYEDEWVLRNLGHVLNEGEEDEILRRLDAGTPEALGELLNYIADEALGVWQNAAREEFAQTTGGGTAEVLTGAANTANWRASRTPGTYYYTYTDDRYLYSDQAQGPVSDWETLPVREQLATQNAQPWGGAGWYCTPTGEPELYGGAFVFAPGQDGPWMTEEQATAQIQAAPAAGPGMPRRYNPVEAAPGYEGWARGYDTAAGVWKFAQVTGTETPGDDAPWTAIKAFRANNTEYFAGPGYSQSGWVPYMAEPRGETVPGPEQTAVAPETAAAASRVREEIVLPAIERLKQAHPGLTDDQAEELIVTATSQALRAVQ